MLVAGLVLCHVSGRMAEQSRVAKVSLFSGVVLLMISVFFLSGAAGLVVIVVADFIETYPRLGFLSRLVLYYVVVLPAAGFLAKGITYLTPRRPNWLKYSLFGIGVLGGSYFLFFYWQLS
jgi:hypothetical protein